MNVINDALLHAGVVNGEVDQCARCGIWHTHAGSKRLRTRMHALLTTGIAPRRASAHLQPCHDAHKTPPRRQKQDQSVIDTVDGAAHTIQEPAFMRK
ncbi:hypothetical protein CH75_23735 [Dyella jiangningensis]|nr:hypothetical protein CH75_00655 [Dyella jiangningensis]AHX16487.1 hypothetical protein CH75_23735 [Dyella jiangningensis]